jgi:hypothetical protein
VEQLPDLVEGRGDSPQGPDVSVVWYEEASAPNTRPQRNGLVTSLLHPRVLQVVQYEAAMCLQEADRSNGLRVPDETHLLVAGLRRILRVLRQAKEEFQEQQRADIHVLFRAEDLRQSVPAMAQRWPMSCRSQ